VCLRACGCVCVECGVYLEGGWVILCVSGWVSGRVSGCVGRWVGRRMFYVYVCVCVGGWVFECACVGEIVYV